MSYNVFSSLHSHCFSWSLVLSCPVHWVVCTITSHTLIPQLPPHGFGGGPCQKVSSNPHSMFLFDNIFTSHSTPGHHVLHITATKLSGMSLSGACPYLNAQSFCIGTITVCPCSKVPLFALWPVFSRQGRFCRDLGRYNFSDYNNLSVKRFVVWPNYYLKHWIKVSDVLFLFSHCWGPLLSLG